MENQTTNNPIHRRAIMKKYQVGDLVWLHDGKGWDEHPLLVIGIIGDHENIKVMSTRNDKYVWFYPPCKLHNHPKGANND